MGMYCLPLHLLTLPKKEKHLIWLVGLEGRSSIQPLLVTPFYGLQTSRLAFSLIYTSRFPETAPSLQVEDWDIYSIQRRCTFVALDLSLFLLDPQSLRFHNAEGLQLGSSALVGGRGI